MPDWTDVLKEIVGYLRKMFGNDVRAIHHCFMHTLMNTQAFKIIENHLGAALVKQESLQMVQVPVQQQQ